MRTDKELALKLREQNKSYNEISKILGVPKSTLCAWFKSLSWSEEIKEELSAKQRESQKIKIKLMAQANKEKWEKWREEHRNNAIKEFSSLKNDPLFASGLMLYWGEGEKQIKSSQVRLGNSEPEMLRIFYLFLTKSLGISSEKIFAWLLLYPDLVDSVQKNFWSKTTGIPLRRFKKSIYIKGRHPKKRLSYGVCTIVVSSRALKERMLKWLELYQIFLKAYALNLEK